MSAPALIEFHNATIWRGNTLVFENLNLEISQHERVAILGPNGSGKTTLLKTINRELYPVVRDDSWVRIFGRERWDVWKLRKKIGVVSHDLHSRYTVTTTAIEVVISGFQSSIGIQGLLASRVSNDQIERADHVLGKLGMGKFRNSQLNEMSTGQQRRCLLGRALVHEPDTLIFDEPIAGLDIAASFAYLGYIRALTTSGHSIVIVTHHLNEIPPEVDRIIMLKDGIVVADGGKADTLTAKLLTEVYETPIQVANMAGHFLAYPG